MEVLISGANDEAQELEALGEIFSRNTKKMLHNCPKSSLAGISPEQLQPAEVYWKIESTLHASRFHPLLLFTSQTIHHKF